MSSAPAFVRLHDGRIMHTTYNGTSDMLIPELFATFEESCEAHRNRSYSRDDSCGCQSEPCQVWVMYGREWGWETEACEHRVHRLLSPWGIEHYYTGEVIEPAVEEVKTPWPWVLTVREEA